MNEKEIFQAAVELSDPAQRQAYLTEACGDNAALRTRVEALLAAHAAASSEFLNVPAMEQAPPTVSGHQQTLELPPTGGGTGDASRPEHDHEDDESDSPVNLSFLQPSTKTGSLGRLGHYEILQVLGQGAFGIVFKAFDEKLHRHVAIKAMSPELASTSPPRKRFLREARSVAALKHENIVQIYSVEEQPLPYLAMEFVDGQTLQQKIDGAGPFDMPEILHLARQMAAGLAAAHEKGLIHRDIKPGNILLESGAEQKVKITDFGLARAADDATMTRTGTIAGTPMYMAPEQAMGQTLDHRADLFSLGSVLYQMACGRPPFRGANAMAVLKRVIDETPRPIQDILPQVPDWLCAIIEKLHAKNPDERYQTAKEVADVLARCQNELQVNGQVTSVPVPRKAPAVVPHPAAPAAAVLPTQSSAAAPSARAPIVALVAAAILLIGGLSVTELTGITHLFRKPIPETVPVAGNSGVPSERGGPEVQPAKVTGWAGWPADAPPPAIAPFDAEQAKAHQEAWAKYLGVPVEFTNTIGMKFRLIPPGEFTMGMTKEEAEAAAAEYPAETYWQGWARSSAPQHRVRLTQPFYLGTYEVTQEQYEKVMGTNPSGFSVSGQDKDKVAGEDTKQHPVEMVSFVDAAELCIKLSKQEQFKPVYFSANGAITLIPGDGYRLPTEAEWEYACRAGTNTAWFHGDQESELGTVAWFGGNSGGMTHPVGQLKANPFGLYDVHGNVWEWCQDWYDPQAYAQRGAGPTVDPRGPDAGSARVLRGGVWYNHASFCRSAFHPALDTAKRDHRNGFRLSAGVDAVRQALKVPGPELPKVAGGKPEPSGVKPAVNSGPGWQPIPVGDSPFDKLDPAAIPAEERFEWQPQELVAVIGNHARRHWSIYVEVGISRDGKFAWSKARFNSQDFSVWDVETQTLKGERFLLGETWGSFSDDSKTLYIHGVQHAGGVPGGVIDLTQRPLASTPTTSGGRRAKGWDNVTRIENGRTLIARRIFGEEQGKVILADVSGDQFIVTDTVACLNLPLLGFVWSDVGIAVYRSKEGQLRRVEIKDSKFVNDRELAVGDGTGSPLAISPDGKRVVLHENKILELWDIAGESPKKTMGFGRFDHAPFVALSADGRWMTTSYSETKLWRIDGSEPKFVGWLDKTGRHGGGSVAFSQDGNRAIVGSDNGFVRFWDLSGDTPKELSPPNLAQAFQPPAYTRPQLDPRTGRLMLHTYDAPKPGFLHPHQLWEFGASTPRPYPNPDAWLDSKSIGRFVPLPNDRWLNLKIHEGMEGHDVYGLWRDGVWQTVSQPFGKFSGLSTVSPDGSWLLAFSGAKPGEYAIEGWDLRQEPVRKWTMPFDTIYPIWEFVSEFLSSHDGSVFAVAHGDGNGGEVTLFRHHGDRAEKFGSIQLKTNLPLYRAALSPDGGWLVHTPVAQNHMVISDIRTGQAQELARRELGYVRWFAFSPDGQRVAYSSDHYDSTHSVGVLDAKTLAPLYNWKSPGVVEWLDFAPDARHLITLNGNHTVYVLRLPPNASGQ